MWPRQSSSWPGDRVGAWRSSASPGEGARPEDHGTWIPRPCPGRKYGPVVTRASHTFHNEPPHGQDSAARPSNRTNQHHGNADGTGQSGRTRQLLPGAASRGSARPYRCRAQGAGWTSQLPPGSTCLRPPPTPGKGATLPAAGCLAGTQHAAVVSAANRKPRGRSTVWLTRPRCSAPTAQTGNRTRTCY